MKSFAKPLDQAKILTPVCDAAATLNLQNRPQSLTVHARRKRASLKRTRSADAVLLDLSLQMPE
ncbi:hypothetical protein [Enterovibrio sp. 27052020O]|uniref:hypothetical protein n=1 Tax=Enterovibrio sp. 27052020O TaxID=3241166 RepID=UPI00389100CC